MHTHDSTLRWRLQCILLEGQGQASRGSSRDGKNDVAVAVVVV